MQFEFNHNTREDFITVTLENNPIPIRFIGSIFESFQRLGGQPTPLNQASVWKFPVFITSNVIKEVIYNTCFVCGGLMQNSTAYQNTLVSFDDFGGDAGSYGTTQSRIGPARQIQVRKCSNCGHSHT